MGWEEGCTKRIFFKWLKVNAKRNSNIHIRDDLKGDSVYGRKCLNPSFTGDTRNYLIKTQSILNKELKKSFKGIVTIYWIAK